MTSDDDKIWFKESLKHDKAWRAALKKERGISAEAIEAKITEAWNHPNIPSEDAEDAKLAFQRSYLLFIQSVESGNALFRELSMTEGRRAFDCGKLLHTKLTLEPEVMDGRAVQVGRAKGAESLAKHNDKRKAEIAKRDDALWRRYCMLTAAGARDRAEAVTKMVEEKRWGSRATVQRVVKEKFAEKSKASSIT